MSHNTSKKIDVFDKDGHKFLCSVGDIRYLDYPYLLAKYGIKYADTRKTLHNLQLEAKHKTIRNYTCVYYENLLLW